MIYRPRPQMFMTSWGLLDIFIEVPHYRTFLSLSHVGKTLAYQNVSELLKIYSVDTVKSKEIDNV